MMLRLLFCLLGVLHVGWLGAQKVSMHSTAADTMRQGDLVDVTFVFDNVSAAAFKLPEAVGLMPVAGPSRRSQMQITNGRRTSSEVITYRFVAHQPGLAYVPAVEGVAGDSTYRSEPLKLFITPNPDYVAPPRVGEAPARPTPPEPPRTTKT